jgi:hypothetical protein
MQAVKVMHVAMRRESAILMKKTQKEKGRSKGALSRRERLTQGINLGIP